MRRAVLQLLRCPRCREAALKPEADPAELVFGPLRCASCHAQYPVGEGVGDLASDHVATAALQWGLEQPFVARSYERYLRPAAQLATAWRRIDRESEFLLYRSLLGRPAGVVLDLACGTGLFARRLARDPDMGPVVGMDVSKPMIEEGVAQAREAGVMVDFLRAEAPPLPFLDDSLGAVLQAGALHFFPDADVLLREIARVLRPGGRFVASTYHSRGLQLGWLRRRAGIYPRSEGALRQATEAAGLVKFERLLLGPLIVFKAERRSLH